MTPCVGAEARAVSPPTYSGAFQRLGVFGYLILARRKLRFVGSRRASRREVMRGFDNNRTIGATTASSNRIAFTPVERSE